MKKKKRKIVVDADALVYLVASGYTRKDNRMGGSPLYDMTAAKGKFKRILEDLEAQVQIESIPYNWRPGKLKLHFSDSRNFRHDIFPAYKAGRPEKSAITKKFIKWTKKRKRAVTIPNTEADDILAYEVRNGAIGMTADKDLLYGVPGLWFDIKHNIWVKTSKEEAEAFVAKQTVAGDSTDGIPGIKGVGLVTAEKLLNGDYSWQNIVNIYKAKGLKEKDAILTRRLVGMDQWNGKEIVLWEPKN